MCPGSGERCEATRHPPSVGREPGRDERSDRRDESVEHDNRVCPSRTQRDAREHGELEAADGCEGADRVVAASGGSR